MRYKIFYATPKPLETIESESKRYVFYPQSIIFIGYVPPEDAKFEVFHVKLEYYWCIPKYYQLVKSAQFSITKL